MRKSSKATPYARLPVGPMTHLIAFPLNHTSSQRFLTYSFFYIYSCLQGFSTTKIIHIFFTYSCLQGFRVKKFPSSLQVLFDTLFTSFNTYNNGFSFTWNPEDIIFCKQIGISKSHGCAEGLRCSLCWRENEAVCDSCIILEPTFIPGLVKSSWGRFWISSSNGRPHNSLQWRCIPTYNFLLELTTKLTLGDWHRLIKTFCTQ